MGMTNPGVSRCFTPGYFRAVPAGTQDAGSSCGGGVSAVSSTIFGVRCEWHGIKPDFVKRAGMVAPRRPLLWHRFIIRPHPIPMLLFIRSGRRDASTFILDRAAPFFRTAWKAIPADSGLIPCHSHLTPIKNGQLLPGCQNEIPWPSSRLVTRNRGFDEISLHTPVAWRAERSESS